MINQLQEKYMLISSQDSYLSWLILVHDENVLFQVTCIHYLHFFKIIY